MQVHIGSGRKRWPGWVNVDGFWGESLADVCADVRALPFETGTVRRAAAIHVLEHLYRWEAEATVREWIRILEPGGCLIIEVPCMDKIFEYIAVAMRKTGLLDMQMVWWALWGDPRYTDPSMVHRWGYSAHELVKVLEGCGLQTVTVESPRYHRLDRDMRVVGYKGVA